MRSVLLKRGNNLLLVDQLTLMSSSTHSAIVLPDEFVLDETGLGLIHIIRVDTKHIFVKIVQNICMRFKVSGYNHRACCPVATHQCTKPQLN